MDEMLRAQARGVDVVLVWMLFRVVVVENLPNEHSMESADELFEKVGRVEMVRIRSLEAANRANLTTAKHPKTYMLVSN